MPDEISSGGVDDLGLEVLWSSRLEREQVVELGVVAYRFHAPRPVRDRPPVLSIPAGIGQTVLTSWRLLAGLGLGWTAASGQQRGP